MKSKYDKYFYLENNKARCLECSIIVSRGIKNLSTTTLIKHLKKKHTELFERLKSKNFCNKI